MVNPQPNHRVLYVDDHADTVELVTLMLEAGGFEVLSRSNFQDGLKAASDQEFDLLPARSMAAGWLWFGSLSKDTRV